MKGGYAAKVGLFFSCLGTLVSIVKKFKGI